MKHPTWLCLLLVLCLASNSFAERKLKVQILQEAEHDAALFTQGLFLDGDSMLEASGGYGSSLVRRYKQKSGEVLAQRKLPDNLFAEGLTLFKGEVFLLTWTAGRAIVLDPQNLAFKRFILYQGEGWGLTHTNHHLITSDGSDTLSFRNPDDFTVTRQIQVRNAWRKYPKLNELEFAEGSIWANVWQSPIILQISPEDGKVVGIASLKDLEKLNSTVPKHSVLNGIAYDPKQKAFWITGKLWPKRYLVRFE